MNKKLISQILAGIVILGGLIVMFGWFFDIPVLKSILPGWVTMKFITAVSFLASGIILLLITRGEERREICNFILLIVSFILLLLMATFFISLFVGVSTGIENLFVKEIAGAVKTSVPGVPAIPTMICFILVALAGLLTSYYNNNNNNNLYLGIIEVVIGGLAIIGYLTKVPLLYYSFPGFTSMAFHTAILFVLIGISLILIGKEKRINLNKKQ